MRALLALTALWPSAAAAATLNVCPTCAHDTIGSALEWASAGDTVVVAAGIYDEAVRITEDVRVEGAGADVTVITSATSPPLAVSGTTAAAVVGFTVAPIDASDQAVTVTGAAVAFEDLAVADVSGSSNGQCLAITASSSVTLTASTLSGCAGASGGAIYVDQSTLEVVSSTISGSYATYGGALYARLATVSLTDATFTDNEAYDAGGHVYVDQTALTTARVDFDGGVSTTNDGGGVYGYLGSWSDTDSTLSNGSAASCGGGAWLNLTPLTATGTTFSGNTAGDCGGAMRTYYADVTLTDVIFDGNSASGLGGGHVYAEGNTWAVSGGAFLTGITTGYGGAMYRLYGATTMADTTLDTHSAEYGGAIYANAPTSFVVERSTFAASDASAQGGHIYDYAGALDVIDSAFSSGTAADAGAIVQVYGSLDVSGSSFADHTVTGWAGAVFPYYAALTLADATFARNAAGTGAGHVLYYGTAAAITGSTFSEGEAPIGSAVYGYLAALSVDASRFEGNTASEYATVVVESGGRLDITDSAFVDNSAGEWHGGAYWRFTGGSVTGTRFEGNAGGLGGGGLAVWADSDVEVRDCAFSGNVADEGGAIAWYGLSGGVGRLTIADSTFDANAAELTHGGALYASNAGDLVLEGNVLSGNTAVAQGGAVAVAAADSVVMTRNTLCGNAAADGGAAWIGDVTPIADHAWAANVLVENTASSEGGGVYLSEASGSFANNDLLGNRAVLGGGLWTDRDVVFLNNLVAWTAAGDGLFTATAVTTTTSAVTYNDFWANASGDASGGITALPASNLAVDPELAGYTIGDGCAGDFKLAAGSPLRDAGAPTVVDADGSPSDIGAYGGPSSPAVDRDGDGAYDDTDCDDADATVRPGAVEVCDGVDQDCDLVVDDSAIDASIWHPDRDLDGFGGDEVVEACERPADAYPDALDCDDADPDVSPVAYELCDGVDDDCDGEVDEDALGAPTWHADADGDGFGDDASPVEACEAPPGHVAGDDDCDDADAGVFPGADERCDGRDEDCDGAVDEDPIDGVWYADADGDGFGAGEPALVCDRPDGYAALGTDCDDADPGAFPGAEEIPGDAVDQDCDGADAAPIGESSRQWAPGDAAAVGGAGCGCAGAGGSPAWAAALLALGLTRRARRERA